MKVLLNGMKLSFEITDTFDFIHVWSSNFLKILQMHMWRVDYYFEVLYLITGKIKQGKLPAAV